MKLIFARKTRKDVINTENRLPVTNKAPKGTELTE